MRTSLCPESQATKTPCGFLLSLLFFCFFSFVFEPPKALSYGSHLCADKPLLGKMLGLFSSFFSVFKPRAFPCGFPLSCGHVWQAIGQRWGSLGLRLFVAQRSLTSCANFENFSSCFCPTSMITRVISSRTFVQTPIRQLRELM